MSQTGNGLHLSGLSLRDLEYAVALDEARHFKRAADRCGVSQPGLSEQVRKLEAILGAPLFERGRSGVSLTVQGAALMPQMRRVVREARGLLEMSRAQAGALEGPLDLGVIPTLGPYYVPLVLAPLRQRFPALTLRLQEGRTGDLESLIRRGDLDAALVALPCAEGLAFEPLFFEPFRVLLPSGHRLLEGAAARPRAGRGASRQDPGAGDALPADALPADSLAGEDLLLLEEGHCLRAQSLSLCHVPSGSTARAATSLEMLRHMVAAGEGFCLFPVLATRGEDDMGGLVHVRDVREGENQAAGRIVGLVWRHTDPRAADFRQLAAFLRDTLPEPLRPPPGHEVSPPVVPVPRAPLAGRRSAGRKGPAPVPPVPAAQPAPS
ncbi:LysR substrate-binding domain-containing protein [Rhizosaccharibacter radicis]|uniref:LysR substrate-binding domain-containing protein n=1 Tax=Rhizosaccharibacter radicis TaxID=2782605 RepID=A0ABT1VT85_9PROT|nr:LysR substrate-binding domain-containing protein [Acetobacteraceae bacterium KSS12]